MEGVLLGFFCLIGVGVAFFYSESDFSTTGFLLEI